MLFTLRKFGILREINFAELKMTKSAILRILEMLDFDIWEISDRKNCQNSPKSKFKASKILKLQFLLFLNGAKFDFT